VHISIERSKLLPSRTSDQELSRK